MKIRFTSKILIVAVVLSGMSIIGNAQKAKVSKFEGKIINSKDQQPLAGVMVALSSTGQGTITNDSGYFSLVLPADTGKIIISSIGFETITLRVESFPHLSSLTISLNEDIQELDAVTVLGEKERIARVSDVQISSIKMSPTLVAKLPNMGEVDVIRSFQLMPGVSATNETSAGLFVRGGTPDQNLILFDGMTIYYVDHFYGFFSAFNANTIDDIELMKGGFPSKYGGRISSIMEISGKPADMQRMNGTCNISFLSGNVATEIPIIKDKVSLQFAVRRSYTDVVKTDLYDKIFKLYNNSNSNQSRQSSFRGGMGNFNQQQIEPDFYFYDLNSKLTYNITNKHTLSFSLYKGKDNLDNSSVSSFGGTQGSTGSSAFGSPIINTNTDVASWGNTGYSGQWKAGWSTIFNSSFLISYSDYFSDRNQSNSMSRASSGSSSTTATNSMNTLETNNVKDLSTRIRNELHIGQNHLLEFGLEHIVNNIKYSLVYNDTSTMVNTKIDGFQTAGYIQDKVFLLNKKADINIGIRSTYQNLLKKMYYEPRISANVELVHGLKFKAAWGKYNQFCTRIIREDVLQGSKDFWLLADGKTVPVSSSTHYIAGTSYEIGNFLFNVEAYYKDMAGLTEYTFRTTNAFRRQNAQQTYFYRGTGYSKGIEFMIQKKYGNNTGWIAYTVSEVKNKFPDLNYGKEYYATQDQPNELKAVYTRKIKRWDFSATFVYATGKPYTAPQSRYELQLLNGYKYTYWHISDKNTIRLPDYHKADLAISYNLPGMYTDKTFTLSIFNIYNHRNIWYKKFQISESDITVSNVNYLGFTPNISFTLKFK